MANLPQSLSLPFGGAGVGVEGGGQEASRERKMASAEQLVLELSSPDLRENALLELSKVCVFNNQSMSFNFSLPAIYIFVYICMCILGAENSVLGF